MINRKNIVGTLIILFVGFGVFNSAYALPTPASDIRVDGAHTDEIDEGLGIGALIGTITNNGTVGVTYDFGCTTPGADDSHFQINIDQLETNTLFDYANPVDANTDNDYEICIRSDNNGGTPPQYFEQNITITVNAVDVTAPVITMNGSANVTVTEGSTYTDAGATCSDDIDSSCSVVTVNPVDTSTLGDYTVTYNAQDNAGNDAVEVVRTVHVERKVSRRSSSRRLSRAEVNKIFGKTSSEEVKESSDTDDQLRVRLIHLLTQLLEMLQQKTQ